jgi:hypothetical protein
MADLTLEQRSAAESRGCRFVPATREQIATLAMQRRVFWVDGQAFLALRPDGFFETATTLQGLLEQPPSEPASAPEVMVTRPGHSEILPAANIALRPAATASAGKRPVIDASKAAAVRPGPAASRLAGCGATRHATAAAISAKRAS